jgi:hypothetical protein
LAGKFQPSIVFVQKSDFKMARPEFKPTAAIRKQVAIAAGAGMAHENIALGLGISRTTLLKHFSDELSTGASKKRLEIISAMFATAKKGNVAAQKAYMLLNPQVAAPDPEKPAQEKPVGKKEQAQVDAQNAAKGTDWNDLLAPGTLQ